MLKNFYNSQKPYVIPFLTVQYRRRNSLCLKLLLKPTDNKNIKWNEVK